MLSALMKKGWLASQMTATPATVATADALNQPSVAVVATVTVADNEVVAITLEEEAAIYRWLEHIGEFDLVMIDEVMNKCRDSLDARAYVLREAQTILRLATDQDDRRHCAQCRNLAPSGLCLAAMRGEICASRNFQPIDDIPRRCFAYTPNSEDVDKRSGRDRWPHLISKECRS